MQTVMGIDLGTQSIKIILYDPASKKCIADASHSLDLSSDSDGSREQLASWWIDGFKACMKAIAPELKKTVVAIGVSGQQHGFVPVGEDGNVLAPVKLWCDTATLDECNEIMAAVGGEEETFKLGGNRIAVGYTASKIRHLKKHNPAAYAAMTSVMLPHDYLNFYLTGNRCMEYGDASGTGLLDIRQRTWCKEIVSAIDPDRDLFTCLPELIEADSSAGTITEAIAKEFGLNANVIVSSGGGDNMMAAIGTGNVQAGQLTASLGTSGTLFGYSDTPIADEAGDLAAFCSSTGGWMPLLCTMNCTVATEHLRKLLDSDLADMEMQASMVPAGSHGVITLPFFNGERTPNLPNGKASIMGLDTSNCTKGHLLRSAMEAGIFALRVGLEAFERNGMTFKEVTLVGGGSKSALWRQICADILNLPVRILMQNESAAYGAALQALWCYQNKCDTPTSIENITKDHLVVDADKGCKPDPATVAQYDGFYKQYHVLTNQLAPLYQ